MNKFAFLLLSILLICVTFSCFNNKRKRESEESVKSDLNPILRISIPQGSGNIFVNYKIFEINHNSLFVINKILQVGMLHVDSMFKYDTVESYAMDDNLTAELGSIISKIDSLGTHSPKGYYLPMGWPRFYINASIKNKELSGSISNCYRENVYSLVDFLNKCYPKGKVIEYDKQELLKLEKELSKEKN